MQQNFLSWVNRKFYVQNIFHGKMANNGRAGEKKFKDLIELPGTNIPKCQCDYTIMSLCLCEVY